VAAAPARAEGGSGKVAHSQASAVAEDTFISVAAVAQFLDRTPRTVHRYIEQGMLVAKREGPLGWWRVSRESMLRLVRHSDDMPKRS
jgi:hypothetical protein